MNDWFKIGAFLMLLVLLTSEDCSNNVTEVSYKERQSDMFHEMENNFEKEQLDAENLKAFENRALQMFADLVDFMNIYADSGLTKDFRLQARQMINDFFLSDRDVDSLFFTLNIIEDEKNALILYNGTEPFQLKADSHKIIENFSRQQDLTYSGKIRFNLSCNISDFEHLPNDINVHILKSQKQFGTQTMEVWGVFMGKIN